MESGRVYMDELGFIITDEFIREIDLNSNYSSVKVNVK